MAPDLGAVEEWRRKDADYAQRLRDLEAATAARNQARCAAVLHSRLHAGTPVPSLHKAQAMQHDKGMTQAGGGCSMPTAGCTSGTQPAGACGTVAAWPAAA